jgi:hypothetical protein
MKLILPATSLSLITTIRPSLLSNNGAAYFIFAGNYREWDYYCRNHLKTPPRLAEQSGFRYLAEGGQFLQGMGRDIVVIRYGTWQKRRDCSEIMAQLNYNAATHEVTIEDDYDDWKRP